MEMRALALLPRARAHTHTHKHKRIHTLLYANTHGNTEEDLGQIWSNSGPHPSPFSNPQGQRPGQVEEKGDNTGSYPAWTWLDLSMCTPPTQDTLHSPKALRELSGSGRLAERSSPDSGALAGVSSLSCPWSVLPHRTPQQILCGKAKRTADPERNAQIPSISCPLPGNGAEVWEETLYKGGGHHYLPINNRKGRPPGSFPLCGSWLRLPRKS